MNGMKHLAFAIVLAFVGGLFWSAQAQVNSKPTKLQGIEVTPGIEDREGGVVQGASFLGKTSGTFPGSFFMSLNYEKTSFATFPPTQTSNEVKMGAWSLPVYSSNQYLGAMYGRVVEGTIEWNNDNTIATVNITLSVDGGTQKFAGVRGKGHVIGTLDRTTRGKPTLSGALYFEF